jgi:putative membrane protein
MRTTLPALAMLTALAACGRSERETTAATTPADPAVATTATAPATPPAAAAAATDPAVAEYAATAASSDMYEIQSSQLALRSIRSPAVRTFAEQMVSDHQTSSAGLAQALADAGAAPPPATMLDKHRQQLSELETAAGRGVAELERTYLAQQRAAHQEALALHRGMAGNSAAPAPLTAFAARTAQTVEMHASMLGRLAGASEAAR